MTISSRPTLGLLGLLLAALSTTSACADAPITRAHIDSDGSLRADGPSTALFAAHATPTALTASSISVTGVLAPQAEGALEDSTRFSERDGRIHLHLRADGFPEAWDALYVWTRGDERREFVGSLTPSETFLPSASFEIGRGDAGDWKVEVFALRPGGPALVMQREFEISRR